MGKLYVYYNYQSIKKMKLKTKKAEFWAPAYTYSEICTP